MEKKKEFLSIICEYIFIIIDDTLHFEWGRIKYSDCVNRDWRELIVKGNRIKKKREEKDKIIKSNSLDHNSCLQLSSIRRMKRG